MLNKYFGLLSEYRDEKVSNYFFEYAVRLNENNFECLFYNKYSQLGLWKDYSLTPIEFESKKYNYFIENNTEYFVSEYYYHEERYYPYKFFENNINTPIVYWEHTEKYGKGVKNLRKITLKELYYKCKNVPYVKGSISVKLNKTTRSKGYTIRTPKYTFFKNSMKNTQIVNEYKKEYPIKKLNSDTYGIYERDYYEYDYKVIYGKSWKHYKNRKYQWLKT